MLITLLLDFGVKPNFITIIIVYYTIMMWIKNTILLITITVVTETNFFPKKFKEWEKQVRPDTPSR